MKLAILTLLLTLTFSTFAQSPDLDEGVSYTIEMSGTLSDGQHAPFWLTSNRYGLSSIEKNSGYLRGIVFRSADADSTRHWDVGYCADLYISHNHTRDLFIQQLYADIRWKRGVLTIGQKQQPMELKNNELSSGSQTYGINAHPFPQLRLALPDYWEIPYTHGWVAFKGHISWGFQSDNMFQQSFTRRMTPYDQNVLMLTRAGYVRIGKQQKPFNAELGLELASQYGSSHFERTENGLEKFRNARNLTSLWHALIGGGSDGYDGAIKNNEGNMLGSWVLRLNYDTKSVRYGLYADHFFEDHSALFHINYDGYAYENGQMVKKKNRWLLYPLKDIMLGADVHLKHFRWLSDAVVEYLYTRYQSGPVYSDRNPYVTTQVAGVDNYYNNRFEPGWQHWGQTLGNPLYLSPIYNTDHRLAFQSNRFTAWHIGIAGQPTDNLHYRLRATWEESLGTYDLPYTNPKRTFSIGIEANYRCDALYKGFNIGAAFGLDRGELVGDNTGGSITFKFEL
ncbi:MAG: hypothetical protein J5616_08425 [Bacteroidaceae bacterium]|nr:hypothetical protein [Bacteroidaceae bacterium]